MLEVPKPDVQPDELEPTDDDWSVWDAPAAAYEWMFGPAVDDDGNLTLSGEALELAAASTDFATKTVMVGPTGAILLEGGEVLEAAGNVAGSAGGKAGEAVKQGAKAVKESYDKTLNVATLGLVVAGLYMLSRK